jgi:hypothetical protein
MSESLTFRVHPDSLAIARLAPNTAVPEWARGAFVTVSRTPSELSIVCADAHVPSDVTAERGRVMFGIEGVVPMTTVGLLAALCGALAARRVPVFAISTFDTDYLLVHGERFAEARAALEGLGHRVTGEAPPR